MEEREKLFDMENGNMDAPCLQHTPIPFPYEIAVRKGLHDHITCNIPNFICVEGQLFCNPSCTPIKGQHKYSM